jgi:TPR repeat protein
VPQDFGRAADYYRWSCEGGVAEACFRLAGMYRMGSGVRRNARQDTALTRRACRLGHLEACPPRAGT